MFYFLTGGQYSHFSQTKHLKLLFLESGWKGKHFIAQIATQEKEENCKMKIGLSSQTVEDLMIICFQIFTELIYKCPRSPLYAKNLYLDNNVIKTMPDMYGLSH